MHPFYILQCSIQNRNVHISILSGALWDLEQVYCGICELGHFKLPNATNEKLNRKRISAEFCREIN